jgi:hypothetical protein
VKKTYSSLLLAGLLFFAFNLSSCGLSKHVDEQINSNTALVFGYINTDNAPSNLKWAQARQLKTDSMEPYKAFRADGDGMFYLENLGMGSYKMTTFGGSGTVIMSHGQCIGSINYSYEFPSDDPKFEKLAFRLSKSGLYYAGSYKVVKAKTNLFKENDYALVKLESPDERELLKRLLPHAEGTKWNALIKKRLEGAK